MIRFSEIPVDSPKFFPMHFQYHKYSGSIEGLLDQWLNFKLFWITYLVGKISRSNGFFFRVQYWLSEISHASWRKLNDPPVVPTSRPGAAPSVVGGAPRLLGRNRRPAAQRSVGLSRRDGSVGRTKGQRWIRWKFKKKGVVKNLNP